LDNHITVNPYRTGSYVLIEYGDDVKPKIFPIQDSHMLRREQKSVPEAVYMAAYEVYCYVYAPQEAMVNDDCRGGFDMGELTAFLYAKSFPKEEWRKRTDEAFAGMKL